ncbi:tRNA (adenosine(37)-N6)-dimethylallyltransferase MiaA [Collinsella provencensis]|uniref:tRNA (adenosine(37)-N6)-dimethylallyltransferase MiaA n=1 Tax=Collinsella provencensis TaxID=1937461 RepID=UPI000C82B5B6|nr:tRNA (adenosine(37)-N6)-dimethylallyltransferase MiaA [Collinsella provencensis]
MIPVVAITGPTAVGKSSVADRLALGWDTEVISSDAMQVYRGMDIGTAKTPVGERLVPLRLVDIVDPCEAYSAALYQRDARREIKRLQSENRVPVLCGGTGLYIRAALDEMTFPKGDVSDERRTHYNQLADELGPEGLHALLEQRDPESAALIHMNNVKRVVRALEMCDEGVSYAEQSAGFSAPVMRYDHMTFALTMDRARLYERINARVDQMMEMGLLDEVKSLVKHGAANALTSRAAIGYKELIHYFDGELSLSEAVDLIKQRSRRYAKKQLIWCRRDVRMHWLDMDKLGIDGAVEAIQREVERHGSF